MAIELFRLDQQLGHKHIGAFLQLLRSLCVCACVCASSPKLSPALLLGDACMQGSEEPLAGAERWKRGKSGSEVGHCSPYIYLHVPSKFDMLL